MYLSPTGMLTAIIDGKKTGRFGLDPRYHGVRRRTDRGYFLIPDSQSTVTVFKNNAPGNARNFQRKGPARSVERQFPHGDAAADTVRPESGFCGGCPAGAAAGCARERRG